MTKSGDSIAPVPKRTLSAARRRLVETMQEINFGRIEGLHVLDGEPVLPPLRVLRDVRFGKANGPHAKRSRDDFALRGEVVELLGFFDRDGTFAIEILEVQHGLPHRMVVETEGGS